MRAAIIVSLLALVLPLTLEVIVGAVVPPPEAWYLVGLMILIVGVWVAQRLTKREVGLRWGDGSSYAVAVAYPIVVLGVAALLAWLTGNVRFTDDGTARLLSRFAQMTLGTVVGVLLTEEGFFRGVLFGSVSRTAPSPHRLVWWTAVVFGLWHLPVALIEKDFILPAAVIPVYVVNATLLGAAWGLLRLISGSVLVPCVAHGVWNGLAYTFFGYGQTSTALGIDAYRVFDPERGLIGVVLNAAVVAWLIRWWRSREEAAAHE